jgi:hypothetical protein
MVPKWIPTSEILLGLSAVWIGQKSQTFQRSSDSDPDDRERNDPETFDMVDNARRFYQI